MPRGKHLDENVVAAIKIYYENEEPKPSARKIHEEMKPEVERCGGEMPSVRSIVNIIRDHRRQSDEQRLAFKEFHWPEAMELKFLPWEASRMALDFGREWESSRGRLPLLNHVKWYWRLHQALPVAPGEGPHDRWEPIRRSMAAHLAALEALSASPIHRRGIERKLLYPDKPGEWTLPNDPEIMGMLNLME